MARPADDGFSDDGLYSDEDMKPPPAYKLNRRRNAFCVTSANVQEENDWHEPPASYLQGRRNAIYGLPSVAGDLIPEETRVLAFMTERGLKPNFLAAEDQESEVAISSDEDDVYFSKRSDESQQTSFVRRSLEKSKTGAEVRFNWKAIADAEVKIKQRIPGFLKYPAADGQGRIKPPYLSAGTVVTTTGTSTGSSSTPRSGVTGMTPLQTSGPAKSRPPGTKAISSTGSSNKTDHRVM